jgi:S-(hydroxymethyl)glutathione dehydrogenase/alcohol dehydrogenase
MTKAAVMYNFNEPLKIESVTVKGPRENEVVVKLAASGVCHTDLSAVQARLPVPPPVILGHEGAGVIEEVGSDVRDLQPGDHVVLSWVENCGKCPSCIEGKEHLCDAGIRGFMEGQETVFEKDGLSINRFASVSSFAERTVVRASAAIPIPKDVPLEKACLIGCGVMTGVGAATNTARVRPGETVAVLGCGGVGLNVIQGAVLCGASTIIAVDLVERKLAMAEEFGATHTVNAKDAGDLPEAIRSLTDGLGVDYTFEVTGLADPIRQAFLSVKRGGTAVIVGVPGLGEEINIPAAPIALEEKSVIGSLYGSAKLRRDMPKLLELYMQKRLKLDELISRRIALENINEAFAAMEAGEVARSVIVYG